MEFSLNPFLVLIHRLALGVGDGPALLGVLGLTLLLGDGDAAVLALLVPGTTVLSRSGSGEWTLALEWLVLTFRLNKSQQSQQPGRSVYDFLKDWVRS